MYRHAVIASLSLGLVLGLAGCGSDEAPGGSTSSPPSASATSTSPRAAAEAEAVAAYDGMWQAMAKAAEVPDPDAPEVRRYAADDALARVVGALVNYRERGQVTRGRPVANARAESAEPANDPTEVKVVDCGDSTSWTTHSKATGVQISPDPRGRRHITAVVKKVDGVWKVTTFDVGDIGSC